MGSINVAYSNFVEFSLSTPNAPRLIIREPKGWEEDGIEYDRHEKYHGIITKFTNKLTFYKDAKKYIESALETQGINAEMIMTKRELLEVGGEVKWVDRYLLYADYKTIQLKEDDDSLTIKFNSNKLADLLATNEDDEFEIERLTTIDEFSMDKFKKYTAIIKGRSIQLNGESQLSDVNDEHKVLENKTITAFVPGFIFKDIPIMSNASIRTKIITRGNERHSSVDSEFINGEDRDNFNYYLHNDITSSNMFFVRDTDVNALDETVEVIITGKYSTINVDPDHLAKYKISLYKFSYNENNGKFTVNTEYEIERNDNLNSLDQRTFYERQVIQINKDEALGVVVTYRNCNIEFSEYNIKVDTVQDFEQSNDLSFAFASDVMSRLMHIISNEDDAFYSKFLGRTEQGYQQDGEGAMLGMISGYWARKFDETSEKYKSLTISLKDLRESLTAVCNLGYGIEVVNFKERLRAEEIDYFYREETVIRLPEQVYEETRKLNSKLYFNSIKTGYSRGGDYEDEQGLDEPNTRTNWVTPIRVNNKEYKQISKVRSDEYGLERLRRLPQELYPNEDTRGDSDNWFLDMKRTDVSNVYEQKEWYDRLAELPTGIHSPATYRSAYFTPLRVMLRHAKIFMAGLTHYRNRVITYANAVANSVLTTRFIGESESLKENQEVPIDILDRAIITPWEIKFKHPLTNDLINLIEGKTRALVNGEYEMVPNIYFKIEFKNQKGVLEKGYVKNVKIREEAEFTIIKSNENI